MDINEEINAIRSTLANYTKKVDFEPYQQKHYYVNTKIP